MEYWSDEVVGGVGIQSSHTPILQYSIAPSLQHSVLSVRLV